MGKRCICSECGCSDIDFDMFEYLASMQNESNLSRSEKFLTPNNRFTKLGRKFNQELSQKMREMGIKELNPYKSEITP